MATKRTGDAEQLTEFLAEHPEGLGSATTSSGNPLANVDATLTIGENGQILLEDWALLDILAHFNRERIPERIVHAKGAGAFGFFEVTHDITKYTAAKVFSNIGKKTPIGIRFSSVVGNLGSSDTVRDPRGFAVKFYSEDGIWDLVGNNTPIFFLRDPILFPSFIHSQKRNPVTNLRDWDAFWDFIGMRPETVHQLMILFSDRGIPDGHRHMHGYGSHTFEFVNDKGEGSYVKFHWRTNQGIKNLTVPMANDLASTEADYAIKDLYNAIHDGNFPSWNLHIQTMTYAEASQVKFNPFDVTKIWPHAEFPLRPVGRMTLNRNPSNYFAEVEQISFSPANMIPGIRASPDRMLQARLFAYHDAHLYRIGANYNQLPVNCPYRVKNFQRDGDSTFNNQGGAPIYHPNSFGGPNSDARACRLYPQYKVSGEVARYDTIDADNFSQPRIFYRNVMNEGERERLAANLVSFLKNAKDSIQQRVVANFAKVDDDLGARLSNGLRQTKVNATL